MNKAASAARRPLCFNKRLMKKTYETPALEEWVIEMEKDFLGGSVQDGGSERVGEEGDDLFG